VQEQQHQQQQQDASRGGAADGGPGGTRQPPVASAGGGPTGRAPPSDAAAAPQGSGAGDSSSGGSEPAGFQRVSVSLPPPSRHGADASKVTPAPCVGPLHGQKHGPCAMQGLSVNAGPVTAQLLPGPTVSTPCGPSHPSPLAFVQILTQTPCLAVCEVHANRRRRPPLWLRCWGPWAALLSPESCR
jgi:hypothetical protein